MRLQPLRATCAVLAGASLMLALSACAPLVVGGGAVVGTLVAVDRRTAGAQLDDENIQLRAASRIREALGDKAHVNVTSYNRQVLLTGEVPALADIDRAQQAAATVENVRGLINELAVMPASSLGARSNDTYITGKVRASLVDAQDLSATAFKVTTERGVVYLMGRVTQREAQRASDIARGVSGVRKVVRMFETISESEVPRAGQQPNKDN
ncbi:hypothetical protein GCM10022279_20200 [Comamonas faecalis]|uniref:BON domain-containing protein n=1 Tax=Comamonas faecalis TaxID=1387849 RepID=A0ABP7REX8_9BURK